MLHASQAEALALELAYHLRDGISRTFHGDLHGNCCGFMRVDRVSLNSGTQLFIQDWSISIQCRKSKGRRAPQFCENSHVEDAH